MVPAMPAPPASVKTVRRLADLDLRHRRLGHEDVGPGVIEIDHDHRRRARRDHLADFDELLGDDAADGRRQRGVGSVLFERGDLRRDRRRRGRAPRPFPRAGRRRAAWRELPRPSCTRLSADATRSRATSRLVAASSRCLREPELFLSRRFEAVEVLLGGLELGSRRGHLRARGLDLRLRLAHVLDPRARLHQAQLRFGGVAGRPSRAESRAARRACRASARSGPAGRDRLPSRSA